MQSWNNKKKQIILAFIILFGCFSSSKKELLMTV